MLASKSWARPSFHGHLRAAYRSGLEAVIAAALAAAGLSAEFEAFKVPFDQPAKRRNYTPDFYLPNGIIIETKGMFVKEDRDKHLWVKAQHPDLDIRFVFSNARAKLRKGSPTTYADWCEKNGYLYGHKEVPKAWLTEPVVSARKVAVEALRR